MPPLLPDDAAHRLYKGKSSAVRSGRRPSKKRPKASARLFSPETTVDHELHAVQATLSYRKGHRSVPGRSGEGSPGCPVQDVRHARRQSGGRHRGRSKGPGCSQTSADEGRIRPVFRMRPRRLNVAHPYSLPLWDILELDSYVIRSAAKAWNRQSPRASAPSRSAREVVTNSALPQSTIYNVPMCGGRRRARGGKGGGAPKRVATYGGRRRGGCTRGQAAGDAAEGRVLQRNAFLTRIKSGDNRGSTATGVSASAGEKDARRVVLALAV